MGGLVSKSKKMGWNFSSITVAKDRWSKEEGRGLFYTKNGKERGLGWLPCVGNPKEEKLLERGRPSRVFFSGKVRWKGVGPKGKE
jgi:hypothetical protein